VGAVYVLLYSRPADGLLGHAHPAIRDILSVSTAEMGIVLFGLSIGSMSGILCSAWLVKRFGTRAVIRTTMCFAVFGMGILSVALWFASPVLFALGLTVFGGSFGSAEVAINVEGAAVEREMNKTVLPMMHGFTASARWPVRAWGWR
jgi:MFS family permease